MGERAVADLEIYKGFQSKTTCVHVTTERVSFFLNIINDYDAVQQRVFVELDNRVIYAFIYY